MTGPQENINEMTTQKAIAESTDGAAWRRALGLFTAYGLATAALTSQGVSSMVRIWGSASYGYCALAIPLSLMMIVITRKTWDHQTPQIWPPAAALFLAGVAAYGAGLFWSVNLLQHAAISLLFITGAVLIFGPHLARAWRFPLAFSMFMIPFGDSLLPVLQTIASYGAFQLLLVVGADAARDGHMISGPVGVFHVAQACAGLRFLMASLMLACLFSWLVTDDWRRRVGIVMTAAAVAIIANAFRVFLIILIAIKSDGGWQGVNDHAAFGILVYGAVFVFLLSIVAAMRPSLARSY